MRVLKFLTETGPVSSSRVLTLVFGCAALAWLPSGVAHHSFAPMPSQDGGPIVEVFEGTIELYRLINPHAALIVNITNDDGIAEDRLVELRSAARLHRSGWTADSLLSGDRISIAIEKSYSPNRGRLRAVLVHGAAQEDDATLLIGFGIFPREGADEYPGAEGEAASLLSRLQERLPACGDGQDECFVVTADVLRELEEAFPGEMGYVQ